MGGNKSKPIAESAKTVLSRRKKLATEEVFDAISTPTTGAVHTPDEAATTAAASSSSSSTAATTRPPVVRLAKNAVDQGYVQDSTILKEMSKWDYVKTTNIKVNRPTTTSSNTFVAFLFVCHDYLYGYRDLNMAMKKQPWHQWYVMRKNN